ncbi:MAG: hypothetical protein MZV70_05725 [Desulfobacterales bacterium]|nr:hypothetical protein [Desulfobacterales bacterium]
MFLGFGPLHLQPAFRHRPGLHALPALGIHGRTRQHPGKADGSSAGLLTGRALTPLLGLAPLLLRADHLRLCPRYSSIFFLITSILAVSTNMWMGRIARMVPQKDQGPGSSPRGTPCS